MSHPPTQKSHGHHHHTPEGVSDRLLLWTVVVNFGLSGFEFIAGVISGSVALMADALHNTNDAAALMIAYVARKISRRGADETYTFGYRRAELIGAMIQLTALMLVGAFLLYEAVERYLDPQPIRGAWMMGAAGVALVVDVVTAGLLWSMSKGSLNVKAAFLHNLTDSAASVAVLAGGAAIHWLAWTWIDPLLTLIIAEYILYMSVGLLKQTASILMEAAPADLSTVAVCQWMQSHVDVKDVHHVHLWQLDEHRLALEAHLVVRETLGWSKMETVKKDLKQTLQKEFHITHCTFEFELENAANGCESPGCHHRR